MSDKHQSHARNTIAYLFQRRMREYQALEDERGRMAALEWKTDYSILFEIEIISMDTSGYALQIIEKAAVSKPAYALQDLASRDFFAVDYCVDWFFAQHDELAGLKRHVLTVDLMRLRVIDYIRRYQTN